MGRRENAGKSCKISVEGFGVKRGSFTLKPIELEIREGEIFAVLGRTGSGKSVLLEAMSGMFRGDTGRILIDGREIANIPVSERGIGFVYQDRALFPHMNVYENIVYGLKMHGVSKREQEKRAEEIMEKFSISHLRDRNIGTLSGGESQRTAMARALILRPEVLLLDEPFSALDPATKKRLYKELLKIHDSDRCTIVFVTHDFREAMELADRVAVLLEGELKLVTEAKRLLEGSCGFEVDSFLGKVQEETWKSKKW